MKRYTEEERHNNFEALEELRKKLEKMVVENPEYLKELAMEYSDDEEDIADSFIKQIHENDIDSEPKLEPYSKYNVQNKGCSKETPLVISETRDFYTRLEYLFLKLLFRKREDVDCFAVKKQSLSRIGDRRIDCLTVRATTECFMLDEELIADPMPKHTHEEKFYFDITAAINCSAFFIESHGL